MILKHLFATALLANACALPAQTGRPIDWQRIVNRQGPQKLPTEHLTPAQRRDLEAAIVASNTVWDDCEDDNTWPAKIEVHRINVGPGHFTLAEAGPGCARSGQGANGAMWILRWDAGKPVVMGDLDGWFDVVLPEAPHGLHDIAAGWHNSAEEYGLTLYRFNGKRYRLVDGTTVHCSEDTGHCTAERDGKP